MTASKWVRVRLTDNELNLLQEMTTGEPTKVIAARLHMSMRTARFRSQALYAKLGVSLRAEAVALALRNGWIK